MQKFLEATGENRDAAVENALEQLGLERDDVSVEVLEIGKKGFLGIGATPARVRVTYEAPDIPAAKPEVKREERKPAPKAEKNERFSPAWIGNSWKSTPSCRNKPKMTITNKGISLQTSVID